MNSHWRAVLGVMLIYLFGCASGWITSSVVHYRVTTALLRGGSEGLAKLVEMRLTYNLHLDADQKEKIHAYFLENLIQRQQLQKQIQPEIQDLNRQTYQEVSALLNPAQRELFRQNITMYRFRTGKGAFKANLRSQSSPGATNTDNVTPSPSN